MQADWYCLERSNVMLGSMKKIADGQEMFSEMGI